MKKWEYMCQRISHDQHDLEKCLDKLGKDGWELVASPRITTNYSNATEVTVLIFKREILEPPVQDDKEIVIGTDFAPEKTPAPPTKQPRCFPRPQEGDLGDDGCVVRHAQ